MDRAEGVSLAGVEGVASATIGTVVLAVGVAATATVAATPAVAVPTGTAGRYELAVPLLIASTATDQEGLGGLVAWIVGGVVFGAAAGFAVYALVDLPITQYGAAGMGAALGGGLGGLVNFVSVGEADRDPDTGVTIDMSHDDAPEPRPADLFDDHPDPVLYVADEGGGPMVRAANGAYGETFDLPPTALEGAPLDDAMVPAAGSVAIGAALAAGDSVDRDLRLQTVDGEATFHVRSVGDPTDGYLLFTPCVE